MSEFTLFHWIVAGVVVLMPVALVCLVVWALVRLGRSKGRSV